MSFAGCVKGKGTGTEMEKIANLCLIGCKIHMFRDNSEKEQF